MRKRLRPVFRKEVQWRGIKRDHLGDISEMKPLSYVSAVYRGTNMQRHKRLLTNVSRLTRDFPKMHQLPLSYVRIKNRWQCWSIKFIHPSIPSSITAYPALQFAGVLEPVPAISGWSQCASWTSWQLKQGQHKGTIHTDTYRQFRDAY